MVAVIGICKLSFNRHSLVNIHTHIRLVLFTAGGITVPSEGTEYGPDTAPEESQFPKEELKMVVILHRCG